MRTRRTLAGLIALTLLCCAALLPAAEITPTKGTPLSKVEIVKVTEKDVVYKIGDKETTIAVKDVLLIDYQNAPKTPAEKYSAVELTDGTTLSASKVLIKGKTTEVTLTSGPLLTMPTTMVANILNNAQNEAFRRDWKSRVFSLRGKEAVVTSREFEEKVGGKDVKRTIISSLPASLGDGDATGESIPVAVAVDETTITKNRKIAGLHGIVFKNVLDAKAPPVTSKLFDATQNVVMVSSLEPKDGGLTVTTPSGAKITYKNDQIARLDYTKGRLEYLSAMTPTKAVSKSNTDEGDPNPWFVFIDSNLNKQKMSVGGTVYNFGLALKPDTELTYDLKGDYREFETVVGFDDAVSALGGVVLTVEGDGRELAKVTITSEDKVRHKTLTLNVKDVQKLKIHLKSDGEFDLSRHLNLADAKIRKE